MKVSVAERQRVRTGCHCKECFGLAELMIETCGDDFGLPRAPGHQSIAPRDVCKGTMTCGCEKCLAERQARIARQQHGNSKRRQPWEPRAARERSTA